MPSREEVRRAGRLDHQPEPLHAGLGPGEGLAASLAAPAAALPHTAQQFRAPDRKPAGGGAGGIGTGVLRPARIPQGPAGLLRGDRPSGRPHPPRHGHHLPGKVRLSAHQRRARRLDRAAQIGALAVQGADGLGPGPARGQRLHRPARSPDDLLGRRQQSLRHLRDPPSRRPVPGLEHRRNPRAHSTRRMPTASCSRRTAGISPTRSCAASSRAPSFRGRATPARRSRGSGRTSSPRSSMPMPAGARMPRRRTRASRSPASS